MAAETWGGVGKVAQVRLAEHQAESLEANHASSSRPFVFSSAAAANARMLAHEVKGFVQHNLVV
jgi:hypothetical protein